MSELKNTKYGMIGDIVKIKWRDSNLYLTQGHKNDDYQIATILSIGELIDIDDEKIVIAGDIVNGNEVRRVVVIPVENIID